jgi:arylsulfatase A-like enzyme
MIRQHLPQTLVTGILRPLLVGLLLFGGTALRAASVALPPNIVFILADDLGYGDLGCYGQQTIRTPRLDRMASEGVRFTQAYAGTTVCAPSRCSLMTGMHTGHARIRGNDRYPLKPEDQTVAEVLRAAGYHTALIGKWGLGDPGTTGAPCEQGFDEFFGYADQLHAHNYYPTFLWRNDHKVPLPNVVPNEDKVGAGVATSRVAYSHDLFANEAIAFLERNRDRPFFLYLAFTLPHANNEARKQGMEVPSDEPYGAESWPQPEKNKAAMISRLDRDVGRVLDTLQELQLDSRTIVFFASDNGPHREGGVDPAFFRSSGPLRGIKRDLYEGGIRVPMIVRWPGRIRPGHVSQQVLAFWDFLPTAAALAGLKAPEGVDGVSMLPALLGSGSVAPRRYLYWEFHENGSKQAIRWKDWKAVRLGPGEPLDLYDLRRDPSEWYNVASAHPDLVARIERYLASARSESEIWKLRPAR